ncbi:glucose-6-phosphate isomerase, partial [Xanthomonas citri pv. citri]|nr:glucose-6-phosphate isomerase [Xanthomonas citri pv. citri]
ACESAGWRAVFTADPTVGGRFSALTAFGLVPTGLAGVDVTALLDDAEAVLDLLTADDEDNPGLQLGAALGGTRPLRDKLVF